MYAVTGITGQVGVVVVGALLDTCPFAPLCATPLRGPPGRSAAARSPLPK